MGLSLDVQRVEHVPSDRGHNRYAFILSINLVQLNPRVNEPRDVALRCGLSVHQPAGLVGDLVGSCARACLQDIT